MGTRSVKAVQPTSSAVLSDMPACPHHRLAVIYKHLASEPTTAKMKVVRDRSGHKVPEAMRKSRGSAVTYMENDVRKLTHAEKAKTLLERIHNGVLATNHFELGHPYAVNSYKFNVMSGMHVTALGMCVRHVGYWHARVGMRVLGMCVLSPALL